MKSADGTLSATVQIAHACAVYTLCGHQTCNRGYMYISLYMRASNWKFGNTNVSTLYFCACKCKCYSVQYMDVQGYVCRIGVLYAAEVKLQGIYSCMYAYHSVHREAQ